MGMMFTEGLDQSALQWIRQGLDDQESWGTAAPDLHQSSSLFYSSRSSDLEESVGSISEKIYTRDVSSPLSSSEESFRMHSAFLFQEPAVAPTSNTELPPTAPPFTDTNEHEKDLPSNIESFSCQDPGSSSVQVERPSATPANSNVHGERTKPTYTLFLSGQAAWHSVIAYEACVRLCLFAWSRGCSEAAPEFLRDECLLLRQSFGLQQVLLQPQEESARNASLDHTNSGSGAKPKTNLGKVKVQVRKVKLTKGMPSGCQLPSFATFPDVNTLVRSNSRCWSGWSTVRRIRILPRQPLHSSSFHGNAYLNAGAQYMKQVSGLLKAGVKTLRSTTLLDSSQDAYLCRLKLRSSPENEGVTVQPGHGDISVFHTEVTADDLLLEVLDSTKGTLLGRASVQLSATEDSHERVRWWPVYGEPDRECVGKVQLFLSFTTSKLDSGKYGVVAETVAYDIVLDAAMRVHQFGKRNLRFYGPWEWLLSEFAACYGVSDVYTKMRYLACVMDVATPTEDCLSLIYELLVPVVSARDANQLTRQEKCIFAELEEQTLQLLASVFENYKSLDESSPSGFSEVLQPPSGFGAPSLMPAVQIFTLLHDMLSPEAQETLRQYFQTAARRRTKRLMAETDELVGSANEGFLVDPVSISAAYSKMKSLCIGVSTEISTDIDIHKQQVLPSSIDLPNITGNIYNVEVCNRLQAFLAAWPPSSPSPPVADLLVATADFQRDLASWGIRPVKGGVDAKDLFHLYILLWIQEKRLQLLECCKLDKVRLAGVAFVEEVYERMKETLNEYEVVVSRWPEYTYVLEKAIAEVEMAVITALEKHYADVLVPLKDVTVTKKLKSVYMQKLVGRRTLTLYSVPNQLGVVLNTIERLLETLRPKLEMQMRSWVACLPAQSGVPAFGERLNEVTVALRTKYRNLLQAIVEKLAENSRMHHSTKLKRILQTREGDMHHLRTQLQDTIAHLNEVFTTRVFVAVVRGYWDRMARDILRVLGENRKETNTKSSCNALDVLEEVFTSQMQKLQGHRLHEKDLAPPRSAVETRSMLSKELSSSYLY